MRSLMATSIATACGILVYLVAPRAWADEDATGVPAQGVAGDLAPAPLARNSRWIAALPLGAGQFQNGDRSLGVAFAASETVAAGLSIGSAILSNHWASIDPSRKQPLCDAACRSRLANHLDTALTVNRVSFAATCALVATGIAQAQVGFVPYRSGRQDAPSSTEIAISFGRVSLSGRF